MKHPCIMHDTYNCRFRIVGYHWRNLINELEKTWLGRRLVDIVDSIAKAFDKVFL
jgi:hypothetical protein